RRDRVSLLSGGPQQPPSRRGCEGYRDLDLRVVAAAGAFIGLGPACIEDVFAARVRFQVSRHGTEHRAILSFGDEVLRLPPGTRGGRTGDLERMQKSVRDEWIIDLILRV